MQRVLGILAPITSHCCLQVSIVARHIFFLALLAAISQKKSWIGFELFLPNFKPVCNNPKHNSILSREFREFLAWFWGGSDFILIHWRREFYISDRTYSYKLLCEMLPLSTGLVLFYYQTCYCLYTNSPCHVTSSLPASKRVVTPLAYRAYIIIVYSRRYCHSIQANQLDFEASVWDKIQVFFRNSIPDDSGISEHYGLPLVHGNTKMEKKWGRGLLRPRKKKNNSNSKMQFNNAKLWLASRQQMKTENGNSAERAS